MRHNVLTVHIVDDDASVRDSLALMLGLAGLRTAVYADAEAFLAMWREEWIGCVVTDLRLPGRSGIELQAALRARGSTLPVVVITAHGDVPSARTAFRADAIDFIEKPFDPAQLRAAIDRAFAMEQRRLETEKARHADAAKLDLLTPREREVLEYAAQGLHAKEIARMLGISPRTVEVHKTRCTRRASWKSWTFATSPSWSASPSPQQPSKSEPFLAARTFVLAHRARPVQSSQSLTISGGEARNKSFVRSDRWSANRAAYHAISTKTAVWDNVANKK